MLVRKATWSGWRADSKRVGKKVGFLNVEGTAEVKFNASWMYKEDGTKRLIKLSASFMNAADSKAVLEMAQAIVKQHKAEQKKPKITTEDLKMTKELKYKCERCEYRTDDILNGMVEYLGEGYPEDGVVEYLCPSCAEKAAQEELKAQIRDKNPSLSEEEIDAVANGPEDALKVFLES